MKLRPYQESAIDFIYEHDQGVLFMEMGAGKTAVMVRALTELLRAKIAKRVLVVATLRVANNVWASEFEQWNEQPDKTLIVAGGPAQQREAIIDGDADIVVITYGTLVWLLDNGLHEYFDTIVFDEITKMKNSKSKRFKAYKRAWRNFKNRYAMTGTPTSQGLIDLYSSMHCIDGGAALGRTMLDFRGRYYIKTGREQWDWKVRKCALDDALDAMHHLAFMISPEEYQDQLPPLVENTIVVAMSPIARTLYQKLENESIVKIGNDTFVASNAGVQANMLQQMCNGFLYKDREAVWLHTAKLDALAEVIDSMQGAPLIIVYKYLAELTAMQELWPAPFLGGGSVDPEGIIADWNAQQLPILYLQPQAAAHGLNLQKGGNTIVWYGHTWSLEDHDQTVARLRRHGQAADTVVSHYLVVHDSIDEDIVSARGRKGNTLAAVRSGILKRKQNVIPHN